MKTLTFTLEDELELRLTELAKREGRTEIEIVREAITAYTSAGFPDWVGLGASKDGVLSEQDEAILQAEWR